MSDRGARWVARLWEEAGGGFRVVRAALLPASALYRGGVLARNAAYRAGLLAARHVAARTVSIGNLRVGGSGKTPLTRWLATEARARGIPVAILSRGYGGATATAHVVGDGATLRSDVAASGDEAVMLARTAGVPVVAGRDRAAAAALAIATFESRLLLCDDAFQHRRLARDLDLVLVDAGERGGVARVLPAGPLREPLSALRRAHVIVVSERDEGSGGGSLPPVHADQLLVRARFAPVALVRVGPLGWEEIGLAALAGQRVLALSGVARPRPLYQSLRDWEADLVHVLEYPDHHPYDAHDWQQISHAGKDVDFIVTTEKDLVKLERFPFERGKLVALRLGVTVDDPAGLLARVLGSLASATPGGDAPPGGERSPQRERSPDRGQA
jgi:tetraacyldisaccharide 4'-kinase